MLQGKLSLLILVILVVSNINIGFSSSFCYYEEKELLSTFPFLDKVLISKRAHRYEGDNYGMNHFSQELTPFSPINKMKFEVDSAGKLLIVVIDKFGELIYGIDCGMVDSGNSVYHYPVEYFKKNKEKGFATILVYLDGELYIKYRMFISSGYFPNIGVDMDSILPVIEKLDRYPNCTLIKIPETEQEKRSNEDYSFAVEDSERVTLALVDENNKIVRLFFSLVLEKGNYIVYHLNTNEYKEKLDEKEKYYYWLYIGQRLYKEKALIYAE